MLRWFCIRKEPLILPIPNGAKQPVFVTVIVIFAIFWIFWYFLMTECFERNEKLSTSMKLNNITSYIAVDFENSQLFLG